MYFSLWISNSFAKVSMYTTYNSGSESISGSLLTTLQQGFCGIATASQIYSMERERYQICWFYLYFALLQCPWARHGLSYCTPSLGLEIQLTLFLHPHWCTDLLPFSYHISFVTQIGSYCIYMFACIPYPFPVLLLFWPANEDHLVCDYWNYLGSSFANRNAFCRTTMFHHVWASHTLFPYTVSQAAKLLSVQLYCFY